MIWEILLKDTFLVLGCGLLGGSIRYLRHAAEREFSRIKLTAGLMASCLCSFGAFALGEVLELTFVATCFLMVLFAFFDGRLLEAIDTGLVTLIEDGVRAIIRVFEHRGTKH